MDSTENTFGRSCLDMGLLSNDQGAHKKYSRSISMVGYGKFFEKGFFSESKFLNESTPSGQKILPKVPL